jgi:sortase (surface protein transpeptidase)
MRKTIVVFIAASFFSAGSLVAHAQSLVMSGQENAGVPVAISIPAISLARSVIPVDITSSGNLGVPPNFVQTGWYDRSPLPGQQGSMIIDGHVDNGGAVPGPFKNLHSLAMGDDVYITSAGGSLVHYKVVGEAVYNTAAWPSQQIFADSGQALLKIITCYGTFVPEQGTYNQRLVVTAVLVG